MCEKINRAKTQIKKIAESYLYHLFKISLSGFQRKQLICLPKILDKLNHNFLNSINGENDMPIIKVKQKAEKEQTRISIEGELLDNIRLYCDWLKIKKIDDFFEQAAEHILKKDKDWLNYLKEKNSRPDTNKIDTFIAD